MEAVRSLGPEPWCGLAPRECIFTPSPETGTEHAGDECAGCSSALPAIPKSNGTKLTQADGREKLDPVPTFLFS